MTPTVDLSAARKLAARYSTAWNLEMGSAFPMSNTSFVAPVDEHRVLKVPWGGDDESRHEGDALELWNGDGAVRLLRRSGTVLLEERANPGDDLSELADDEATAIALGLATKLWRPRQPPFRSVEPEVRRWLDNAALDDHPLIPLANELLDQLNTPREKWLVHGDFHHHNILRSARGYVAIDPKPYLADREYDVASFLWNPLGNNLRDADQIERRIRAFVGAGLDEFRIRAWAVIRGSYLRGEEYAGPLRALVR